MVDLQCSVFMVCVHADNHSPYSRKQTHTHVHMNVHSQTHTLTVPVQVQNVQVFVYFPMLTSNDVSALVTWDALTASQGGGFVQNYTVQVFQDGQLLTNVSPSACSLSPSPLQ